MCLGSRFRRLQSCEIYDRLNTETTVQYILYMLFINALHGDKFSLFYRVNYRQKFIKHLLCLFSPPQASFVPCGKSNYVHPFLKELLLCDWVL